MEGKKKGGKKGKDERWGGHKEPSWCFISPVIPRSTGGHWTLGTNMMVEPSPVPQPRPHSFWGHKEFMSMVWRRGRVADVSNLFVREPLLLILKEGALAVRRPRGSLAGWAVLTEGPSATITHGIGGKQSQMERRSLQEGIAVHCPTC